MPPPTHSPVTGKPVPPHYIHSSSAFFQDTKGRALLLRGVNFTSSSKAPLGQPSWSQKGFWEEAEAGRGDWIGRPLNLEDGSADVHLARLKAWGFNFFRYVFTWESLEHEGPGKYDEAYMDYVVRVLRKCKEWGFRVFMDPHQDVWSRFSGGSGAPLWTLYACGIDPRNMSATYGALIHCEYPSASDPKPSTFPGMIWGTNYTRLVSQTIFTLFFAGKTFAPKCIIDGKNIQDYLQGHFIDACAKLAQKIADAGDLYDECVLGWDSLNEPGTGLVEHEDLGVVPKTQQLKKGTQPTPIEGMRLGMGHAVLVDEWGFGSMGPYKSAKKLLDPRGTCIWLKKEDEETRGGGKWGWKRDEGWEMGTCIWGQHGVWDVQSGALLKPRYFATIPSEPGRKTSFVSDFFSHHWLAYTSRIRLIHPEAIVCIQAPVLHPPPKLPQSFLKGRACQTPHYYDGLTLMTKHWNWYNADALGVLRGKYWSIIQAVRVGEPAIRKCIQDQLGILKQDTADVLGEYPTMIGELGCPFDMDDKKAYGYVDGGQGEGDYSNQQHAWDCSLNACDGPNLLNFTLWNYCPDNSHEFGDLWNGEDLSIFSPDDMDRPSEIRESSPLETPLDDSKDFTSTKVVPASSPYTPETIASGSSISSSLLLDGSRAIAAICRPFPVATVGRPERADFDLHSSTFKFSVVVSHDDYTDDNCVTELYIPLVHYAASLGSFATMDTSRTSLLSNPPETPNTLLHDIEVEASTGTWSITGQTLYWKYQPPSIGQQTYTIQIKRRGGTLVRPVGLLPQGSWRDIVKFIQELDKEVEQKPDKGEVPGQFPGKPTVPTPTVGSTVGEQRGQRESDRESTISLPEGQGQGHPHGLHRIHLRHSHSHTEGDTASLGSQDSQAYFHGIHALHGLHIHDGHKHHGEEESVESDSEVLRRHGLQRLHRRHESGYESAGDEKEHGHGLHVPRLHGLRKHQEGQDGDLYQKEMEK